MKTFPLNSDDAAFLLAYEKAGTISHLAKDVQRDPSVVSRNLKRISEELPVLEKNNGKLEITDLGKEFIHWAQEALHSQLAILNKKIDLKIGSTREFADRFLIHSLFDIYPMDRYNIRIITFDANSEDLILNGQADLVFDCGKPYDPQISFKRVADEKISFVASKNFMKKHKIKSISDLKNLSYIHFSRNNLMMIKSLLKTQLKIDLVANDIALVRSTIISDSGWSLLPNYTIKEELKNNKLALIPGKKLEVLKFGVWWNRDKKYLMPHISKAINWLSKIDLN